MVWRGLAYHGVHVSALICACTIHEIMKSISLLDSILAVIKLCSLIHSVLASPSLKTKCFVHTKVPVSISVICQWVI